MHASTTECKDYLIPFGLTPLLIVQELCESRSGRPGPVRPNEPSGFRGRKAIPVSYTHLTLPTSVAV